MSSLAPEPSGWPRRVTPPFIDTGASRSPACAPTSRYIDEHLGTEACSDRGSRNDGTVISEVDLGLRDLSARLSGLRGCHFERGSEFDGELGDAPVAECELEPEV